MVASAWAAEGGGGGAGGKSHLFPLAAKHSYGDGYGAGRDHQGQDIFSKCGKPIIAARAGRVEYNDTHSAAGNYIVINGKNTSRDYMYAHMKRRSKLRVGKRVGRGRADRRRRPDRQRIRLPPPLRAVAR